MKSERVRIWIGFVIVSTVWGSTWLAIKMGSDRIPPFLAASLRFAVASLILFAILKIRKIRIPVTPETKKLYLILTFLSYSIPFALVYWGQQYIPSALGSILFAAYPFSVAIFSHLILHNERLTSFKVTGIAIGFVGLVVIFAGDVHWTELSGILGMSAILASTIMQALAIVLIKKYGQPISPIVMNLVGMLLGGAVLFLLSVATESFESIVWDGVAIGSVVYLATVGSVLAFVTYHWLLKRTEAVYLSLVSFINPIVAVVLGAVVLDEALAPAVFVGTMFVFAGIVVANGRYFLAKFRSVE